MLFVVFVICVYFEGGEGRGLRLSFVHLVPRLFSKNKYGEKKRKKKGSGLQSLQEAYFFGVPKIDETDSSDDDYEC